MRRLSTRSLTHPSPRTFLIPSNTVAVKFRIWTYNINWSFLPELNRVIYACRRSRKLARIIVTCWGIGSLSKLGTVRPQTEWGIHRDKDSATRSNVTGEARMLIWVS